MKRITGRSWAFVMYPESMPNDWKEIILNTGLPMAISPLHDKDLEADERTPKKPHYHVVIYYENPTTFNSVKTNVTDKLNATIPIKLESMRGMYRYHLHLDNPEKYQYDDRERQFFNGFDLDFVQKMTATEINKIVRSIHEFIEDNDVLEYSDLMNYLRINDMIEWYEVAMNKTTFLNTVISSRRNKKLPIIDKKTTKN